MAIKLFPLGITGEEVKKRLNLAVHNSLFFDSIVTTISPTVNETKVTSASNYTIVYLSGFSDDDVHHGIFALLVDGTYYINWSIERGGETVTDSAWYNNGFIVRSDRTFICRSDRQLYIYDNTQMYRVTNDGTPGTPGSDGITPHINPTTKHWMIGDEDTGIVAEGKDGEDGTNGTDGQDGKSAYQTWLETDGLTAQDKTEHGFLVWLQDRADNYQGPIYVDTVSEVTQEGKVYYVPGPDSDKYRVMIFYGGESHVLATRSGMLSNYTSVYDISAANENTPYSTLQQALAAITDNSVKKGGMTVKYLGTDGKYHQYRYTLADATDNNKFTNEDNWEEIRGIASGVKYDNSHSRLVANNVQDAVDEVAEKANVFRTISRNADFGIVDAEGNLLAEFANGHFITKKFNSALVPSYGTRVSELDFAITDEVGQDIVQFLNGHIKTKKFYSADIAGLFNIRGKRLSIIGDSISTFTGYIPSGYAPFYPKTSHPSVNSVEKTWWYQVINKLGLVLGINASWSGCKLTLGENANSTTNAYVACSPKRIEDIGANGTPDIIICFVGTNDFGYHAVIGDYDARSAIPELSSTVSTTTPQNEFADAYAVMIDRIRTAYPTAKLFCCTILDRASAFPPTNSVPATMSDYNRKIIELCNNMGVNVIRIHECGISVWNSETYLQDGLHPKSNGMELISNCVVKELIKNF